MVHILEYTLECYLAIKKIKLSHLQRLWVRPESVLQSGVSQKENSKHRERMSGHVRQVGWDELGDWD